MYYCTLTVIIAIIFSGHGYEEAVNWVAHSSILQGFLELLGDGSLFEEILGIVGSSQSS